MKGGYGEFCPIAKASEVFATRWTPLVLRELMLGAHSFNDIHRGVPLMSRTLLAERLRQLEENGIIARKIHPDNSGCEYWLTQSGEAFHDVLRDLSRWGLAHARDRLTADDLNPGLLMWRMRKRVDISAVKRTRVVGHTMFEFRADMINAFNHPNFVPVVSTSTNADNWRVTAVQENSNRTIQLVMRFSW